jgi:hypothetical protein
MARRTASFSQEQFAVVLEHFLRKREVIRAPDVKPHTLIVVATDF